MSNQTLNPYTILGVTRNADEHTIRTAYRRLALEYHPDKIQDPDLRAKGEEKFKELQNAYEILIDATKRAAVDRTSVYLSAPRKSSTNPTFRLPTRPTSQSNYSKHCQETEAIRFREQEAAALQKTANEAQHSANQWLASTKSSCHWADQEGARAHRDQPTVRVFSGPVPREYAAACRKTAGAHAGGAKFASNASYEYGLAAGYRTQAAEMWEKAAEIWLNVPVDYGFRGQMQWDSWREKWTECKKQAEEARRRARAEAASETSWKDIKDDFLKMSEHWTSQSRRGTNTP